MRPPYIIIFKHMETRENYMRDRWLQLLRSYIIVILYMLLTVNISRLTKKIYQFYWNVEKDLLNSSKKEVGKNCG